MEYNILDLFCGTGSFAHGFLQHSKKYKLAAAIDILKVATETVRANNPNCFIINEDIRKVNPFIIKEGMNGGKIDLIIGGPPCQGFSSIRPNRSNINADSRNNLFQEFARFVQYFRPTYFVLENVVGLLTHNGGMTLRTLERCFADLDYYTDWRILNAANFGVPQKRERFILIGSTKKEFINFPQPTHNFKGKIIGYNNRSKMIIAPEGSKNAITLFEAISDLPKLNNGEESNKYRYSPLNDYQRKLRKDCKQLTLHEASNHSLKMLEIIKHSSHNISSIPSHLITSGFSSCYSRMNPNEPANTITVKFRSPSSSKCIHPYQDRSLTIREAARIQGFEDDFKFSGSNTDISSLIGNAVPAPLGEAIAASMLASLNSIKKSTKSEYVTVEK